MTDMMQEAKQIKQKNKTNTSNSSESSELWICFYVSSWFQMITTDGVMED